MKITAVIPCLNEQTTIAEVINKSIKHCNRVIVVDNNSSDNTRLVAQKILHKNDILFCSIEGAGIATSYGLADSLCEVPKYYSDIIVTLDGDGQHNPNEIPELIKPILEGNADLVIGSRFMDFSQMPKYRRLGIGLINWACNIFSKTKLTDWQSCFRAFSHNALKDLLPIEDKGFAFSVEMMIKARAKGLMIVETPIKCLYHKDFRLNSSSPAILHGLIVMIGVIKWRWKLEVLPILK